MLQDDGLDFNLLDAAAEGQDISEHLEPPEVVATGSMSSGHANSTSGTAPDTNESEAAEVVLESQADQEVLETMKANAQKLPPSEQEKLAMVLHGMPVACQHQCISLHPRALVTYLMNKQWSPNQPGLAPVGHYSAL